MAKAKAADEDLPAAEAPRKREDIGKVIEDAVGSDLDWPDEDEVPGAHKEEPKPAPKAPKKATIPPPDDEPEEDAAAEEGGEDLEDEIGEDGEPLSEQDKKINSLKKQLKTRDEQLAATSVKGEKERRAAARTTIEANLNAWDQHVDKLTLEVTQKKEKLIADQAKAWDDGDNALAAKLGADIQQEVIALDRIAGKKAEITGNKKFMTENPNWVPDLPAETQDTGTADDDMTPPARAWIKDHPQYNTDKKFQRSCEAAHFLFVEGMEDGTITAKLDSPQYFAFIEKHLIKKKLLDAPAADDDEGEDEPAPAPRKRVQPQNIAAPGGSRGGGSPTQGGGKVKATLTPEELEAATMSGYDITKAADLLEYKEELNKSRNKKK